MNSSKNVNLSKMNNLGVISVARDRIYSEDAATMLKSNNSLTESFFKRMQQSTYTTDNDCILSLFNDSNLIIAHFDKDAIFLLSENPIISPKEFINVIANLQNCSQEMRNLITRTNRSGFSDFSLYNLNINFANIELATGMSPEIVSQYLGTSENSHSKEYDKIGLQYDTKKGTISHIHTSQYGINLLKFLNEMISKNPDIRLLMSNVVCRERPINLQQALEDALGFQKKSWQYQRGEGLSEEDYSELLEKPIFRSDDELLEAFSKEKTYQLEKRNSHNQQHKVYPAFKYVVELLEKTKNVDEKYYLDWWDTRDSDTGTIAINTALNNILKAQMRESDTNILAPRAMPEVKDYMEALAQRAHELSKTLIKDPKIYDEQ